VLLTFHHISQKFSLSSWEQVVEVEMAAAGVEPLFGAGFQSLDMQ
jgi:hypothetical protein